MHHTPRSTFTAAAACRLALVLGAALATFLAQAQTPTQTQAAPGRPAMRGGPEPEHGEGKALTAEQTAKVKSVLAAYKPDKLTADDAKAIKRALREAALRPNRALGEAIRAAGFSPDKLEQLDPRPPGPPPDGAPPGGGGNGPPPKK